MSLAKLVTPVKGLNILETLNAISFEFKDLKNPDKSKEMFKLLLYIGHLKELGRANLNMNLFVRGNHQSGYEYNYKDPIGRGIRFAEAEKRGYPDFKKIANCPCCGEKSMVIYKLIMDDIFNPGENLIIEWVKCYTCDYHLRYNVGDPMFFDLNSELIFDVD